MTKWTWVHCFKRLQLPALLILLFYSRFYTSVFITNLHTLFNKQNCFKFCLCIVVLKCTYHWNKFVFWFDTNYPLGQFYLKYQLNFTVLLRLPFPQLMKSLLIESFILLAAFIICWFSKTGCNTILIWITDLKYEACMPTYYYN